MLGDRYVYCFMNRTYYSSSLIRGDFVSTFILVKNKHFFSPSMFMFHGSHICQLLDFSIDRVPFYGMKYSARTIIAACKIGLLNMPGSGFGNKT